jgi:Cu(I)/Ag(I) efflux system membrane fusion protein
MRKSLLYTTCALSLALAFTGGCKKKSSGEMMHQPTTMQAMYTCPMHPEVVMDTPGKCPKCGTQLVVKK